MTILGLFILIPYTDRDESGDSACPSSFSGKPDSLTNCTILNQTSDSIHIECIEGFDGGLIQDFLMEIYDIQSGKKVGSVVSKTPSFVIGGLKSGLVFDAVLYAMNKKGKSKAVHLEAFTTKSAQRHTGR